MSLLASTRAAVAVVGAVLALLVGCSSGGEKPGAQPSVGAVETPSSQQRVARCMTEQGWDVQYVEGDESLQYTYTEDQRSAFDAAMTACEDSAGEGPVDYAQVGAGDWERLYARESETAACLRGKGVDVPQIPSQASYVERYQGADPWTAYGFVGQVPRDQWERLNDACPQPEF